MYFRRITIEHVGPIGSLSIEFPFSGSNPKPLVLAGKNGSGKSILLAHLVNFLLVMKNTAFPDNELTKGKLYKYSSPKYVKIGESHYFSKIELDNDFSLLEWWLANFSKKQFEDSLGYCPNHSEWNQIPETKSTLSLASFEDEDENESDKVESMLRSNCCLYFPVDRFEDPGWMNSGDWIQVPEFVNFENISGKTRRKIIRKKSLEEIKNWLLDVLFDELVYEYKPREVKLDDETVTAKFPVGGRNANIHRELNKFFCTLFNRDGVRLGFGNKHTREVALMIGDNQPFMPSIFNLSSGELALFNIFSGIIRDYDLAGSQFSSIEEIQGIVIIDEIDLHLHTKLQATVLPKLIELFPKVQFVITTHSPLFLLGMREKFGNEGFDIREMPTGRKLAVEDFCEFKETFNTIKATQKFEMELLKNAELAEKPLVYVEGPTDVQYIQKAAEKLGKTDILEKIDLQSISNENGSKNGGSSWLNKAKEFFSARIDVLNRKLILIYDPDEKVTTQDVKGKIFIRGLVAVADNPLGDASGKRQGIESLFPESLVKKADQHDRTFFEEVTSRKNGTHTYVSDDLGKKTLLCGWICKNGTEDDFSNFEQVFSIFEEVVEKS